MCPLNPLPRLTFEQYVEAEEKSEIRHEFLRGNAYAMAGGSLNHGLIIGNTYAPLHEQLRGTPCRARSSDTRVYCAHFDIAVYPDIVIACHPEKLKEGRTDTLTDAIVVSEALSPSTSNYDKAEKFEYYISLPSFRDYVLISQDVKAAQHYVRLPDDSWNRRAYTAPDSIIELQSIKCRLDFKRIYDGVNWGLLGK